MQAKPKRGSKYAFRYLILGIILGLILVVVISAIGLFTQNMIFTFNNLVSLHTSNPLFLVIDALILFSIFLLFWVGREKDRVEYSKKHAEWLTQNHQLGLQQLQTEQDQKNEAHILQLQTEQDQKHQAEILQLQTEQTEQDDRHAAEILLLTQQLDEQGKKFQDLEAVIRRGKQQWEATFDAVGDLIFLTDEAGVILRCNRAVGETFQLGYSQIIGRGIDELFANGSNSLLGTAPGEKKELKAPNSEDWYEASKNHLLIDGRQEGWVYIFRDITPQKHALQEQQRLTHYYELLVNNSPVSIVTLNLEDRIIDCNPAFENMFLYSKREALGQKADLLISSPDLVYETRGMADTVRKGETAHKVTQRRRKDGSLLDVEVFGIPVILGGKQVGSLGLYHDVSELVRSQKAAPDELERAPGEAARILMTKFVDDAFIEQPAPTAYDVEEPELVEDVPLEVAPERGEAVPLEGSALEPAGQEQVAVLEQVEEAVAVVPSVQTPKRLIPVEKIEGIGPAYAQKLLEIGVKTTGDLLEQGKTRKGREELVEKTGISSALVLKWVNMADLMRVHGIGEEYSELLEKAGVDTVKELRSRNPKNLTEAMVHANEEHKLVRRVPHYSEVEAWVKEAKELEPVMTY